MQLRSEAGEVESGGASSRLTQDELSLVLNEAIALHGEAERREAETSTLATLEDAMEIAGQLSIPEEHVRAAVANLERRKLRERRRGIALQRRKTEFMVSLVVLALAALVPASFILMKLSLSFVLLLLGSLAAPALIWAAFAGWRWLSLPVTDEEADRVELMPVAGECRVCGKPAYSPRATFCEEHRYQGPD